MQFATRRNAFPLVFSVACSFKECTSFPFSFSVVVILYSCFFVLSMIGKVE